MQIVKIVSGVFLASLILSVIYCDLFLKTDYLFHNAKNQSSIINSLSVSDHSFRSPSYELNKNRI